MEKKLRCEIGSLAVKVLIKTIDLFTKMLSFLSSLASNPLVSIVVAFYSLILLYFPRVFLDLVFSPVLISTGILLSTLLRLGATQRVEKQSNKSTEPEEIVSKDEDHKWVLCEADTETSTDSGFNRKPFFSDSFVEWNVRAPLEVIYEEYEGEEEEGSSEKEENRRVGIDRLPSLSLYYPETDSDSSSDGDFPAIKGWDSPESICFRWEEEDKDEMIEIPLDGKRNSVLQLEEENLIEIDISPFRAPTSVKFS